MTTEPIDVEVIDGLDASLLTVVRRAFTEAGFDGSLIERAEAIAPRQLDRVRLPAVWWWLRRQPGPAAILARLFAYADCVSADEVETALPREVLERFLAGGVLARRGEVVISRVRVMPFEGLWIASDEMDAPGDPVMGPGATTARLARACRVEAGETVLDVGCGAGSLALLAASRGAGEVVGVDLLARAVAWSRFNARLNGLEATFLCGDLTAPVAGRRFDLVVSQPPFVIQPGGQRATTYLHGGRTGDELALRLAGELDDVLADRGRALMLYDAPVLPGQTVEERLRQALGDAGLRALVVAARGHDADLQAIAYSSIRHPELGEGYRDAVFRVRDHLAELGVSEGLHLLVDIRRAGPGEPALVAVAEVPSLAGWTGEALEIARGALDMVTGPDDALLERRIGIAADAKLVEERSIGRGESISRVRFEAGRNEEFILSDAAAVLVDIVQRESRVRKIVSALARAAGARSSEVRAQALGFIRQSLLSGLFVPLDVRPPSLS